MKKVVGVFSTSIGAFKSIESMINNGIDERCIYAVVLDDFIPSRSKGGNNRADLEQQYFEWLKPYILENGGTSNDPDYLLELGVIKGDIKRYGTELEDGNILVLVDSQYEHGITPLPGYTDPETRKLKEIISHSAGYPKEDIDIKLDERNTNTLKADLIETRGFDLENIDRHVSANDKTWAENRKGPEQLQGHEKEYEEEVDPFDKGYLSSKNPPQKEQEFRDPN